jgi:molybdopterin synthase sulfur carrier subunit
VPTVRFTRHLSRFFPDLREGEIPGQTVAQVLDGLDARHPGLGRYLREDDGRLRKHVNVFVDGDLVHDRVGLTDATGPDSELFVVQALSGG